MNLPVGVMAVLLLNFVAIPVGHARVARVVGELVTAADAHVSVLILRKEALGFLPAAFTQPTLVRDGKAIAVTVVVFPAVVVGVAIFPNKCNTLKNFPPVERKCCYMQNKPLLKLLNFLRIH